MAGTFQLYNRDFLLVKSEVSCSLPKGKKTKSSAFINAGRLKLKNSSVNTNISMLTK